MRRPDTVSIEAGLIKRMTPSLHVKVQYSLVLNPTSNFREAR